MFSDFLICFLSTFVAGYTAYLGAVFIMGMRLEKESYPEAKPQKVGVLIPCHNEEAVIHRLIDALKHQDYPKDLIDIIVIAHNCEDRTAEIASKAEAEVVIFNNDRKRTKADALDYGIEQIRDRSDYSYLAFFDADSIPEPSFMKEINNAMATGCDGASGWISSVNFSTNIISKCCSMLYLMTMNCHCLPHNHFRMPVNIYGSGFCIRYPLIKDGWNTRTLVEDFEFVVKEVLNNRTFIFAPNAVLKAEMPIDLKSALIQRKRWAFGDTQCFFIYIKDYLKSLRRIGKPAFKQLIDLCLNPFMLLGGVGIAACIIKAFIVKKVSFILILLGSELALFCLIYIYSAIITLKREGMPIGPNLDVVAMMPLWFAISLLYAIESFFVRKSEFEKTAHTGVEDESDI